MSELLAPITLHLKYSVVYTTLTLASQSGKRKLKSY